MAVTDIGRTFFHRKNGLDLNGYRVKKITKLAAGGGEVVFTADGSVFVVA
jgi:hypothetical protein